MNRDKIILHIDMNNFFASVETLYHPEYKEVPMAVAGDSEERHGIILAKNMLAKKFGVQTAEPIWQARKKCPELVLCKPHSERYMKYSNLAYDIYSEYTDKLESFGLDECWLDVTGSVRLFGSGREIAEKIRERIKKELGLTVSIGVSFTKEFAKLGSDYKKPDAVTEFSRENYKELVWPMGVEEILYVGRATKQTLNKYGIKTIGQIAESEPSLMQKLLGKNGYSLWRVANGLDSTEVQCIDEERDVKSVSNSTTTSKDMVTEKDVKVIMFALCEKVAMRLRKDDFVAYGVSVSLRRTDLYTYGHQKQCEIPMSDSTSIFNVAYMLFKEIWDGKPLRSIGVKAFSLSEDDALQCSLYPEEERGHRKAGLENTVDILRSKFGDASVMRAVLLTDSDAVGLKKNKKLPSLPGADKSDFD